MAGVMSMASLQAHLPSCRLRSTARPSPVRAAFAPCQSMNRGLKSSSQLLRTDPAPGMLSCPSNGATVFAMRHRKGVPKLNRPADQRKALLRGLTTETLRHGRIVTTKTKAKAVRKYVDKMIQLAKDGSLHSRRQALSYIYDKNIVKSLFEQAPKRYGDRNGGYCRVTSVPWDDKDNRRVRRGDSTEMAYIELV